jgi:hypothetical protein
MAYAFEIEKNAKIPGLGDVAVYKVTLTSPATSATLDEISGAWSQIFELTAYADTTAATKDVYFDGTDIKLAGFTANDVIRVCVKGIMA